MRRLKAIAVLHRSSLSLLIVCCSRILTTVRRSFCSASSAPSSTASSSTTSSAIPIDGKALSQQLVSRHSSLHGWLLTVEKLSRLEAETKEFVRRTQQKPTLAIVTIDPSKDTLAYIKVKREACEKVGFDCHVKEFPSSISEADIIKETAALCSDVRIHGVIAQLPLPKHIDSHRLIESLLPEKDVDGLHPFNLGRLFLGRPTILPAAPLGILRLLKSTGIRFAGKTCVVVGRGNLVAKPTAALLFNALEALNITLVDVKAPHLAEMTRRADVLVVSANFADFITADMVKEGAVIIDSGIHYVPHAQMKSGVKLKGNVDLAACLKSSRFTPVPGGVGPMTVACLLHNTLRAAQLQLGLRKLADEQ